MQASSHAQTTWKTTTVFLHYQPKHVARITPRSSAAEPRRVCAVIFIRKSSKHRSTSLSWCLYMNFVKVLTPSLSMICVLLMESLRGSLKSWMGIWWITLAGLIPQSKIRNTFIENRRFRVSGLVFNLNLVLLYFSFNFCYWDVVLLC